jgi:putative tricarboxylic transport membrane protein
MRTTNRVWAAFPYAVLLALAAWFYRLANGITFDHQGNNLGPDFWPRAVLAAMMVICFVQIGRLLAFGRPDDKPVFAAGEDDGETDGPRSSALLGFGMLLTIAYGVVVTTLGFLISTFLFMVLFIYAGRYRAHLPIILSSAAGAVLLTVLFQKVVYVSLPRGVAPFSQVADTLLSWF